MGSQVLEPVRSALRATVKRRLTGRAEKRVQGSRDRSDVLLENVSNLALTLDDREILLRARGDRDVCWTEPDSEEEPLVTVRIATRNRPELLVERAVASALRQTYQNIEILVVGDACGGSTADALAQVKDSRVRYLNLPRQGRYPTAQRERWMVAATLPWNIGNALAEGHWIAPLDDDDEFTPEHVEVLLREAKERRLEMVYSKALIEDQPGRWDVTVGSWPMRADDVQPGTMLFSAGLSFMQYSRTCYLQGQCADWNHAERMHRAGVKIGFVDKVTYRAHRPGHTRGYSPD